MQFRKDKEKREILKFIGQPNESEQLYLISGEWIKMWAEFALNPEGTIPGDIVNDSLYMKIENKKALIIGQDVCFASERMWAMFYDWYGGGPILKWKLEINEPPAQISSRPIQI